MKVYLVYDDGDDGGIRVRGVFTDETVAERAREAGLGEGVEELPVLDEVPARVRVWQVSASVNMGVREPFALDRWETDLDDLRLDELIATGSDHWLYRSLDREKAVAAVTGALAARRRELGVPGE